MARILGELDDVPERDAQVFEQLPRRMREAGGDLAPQLNRDVGHGGAEVGVRLAPVKSFRKLLADLLVVGHGGTRRAKL